MTASYLEMIMALAADLETMSSKLDDVDSTVIELFRKGETTPVSLYSSVLAGHLLVVLRGIGTKEQAEKFMKYAISKAFEAEEQKIN